MNSQEYTTRSIISHLYALPSPQERWMFWWLCVLNIFMGFFEIGVAGGISLLGVAMSSPEKLAEIPLLAAFRAVLPFPAGIPVALQFLSLVLGGVCLGTLLKNALLAYLTWLQNRFSQQMAWGVGSELFNRFLAAPYVWHQSQNSAELLTALNWKSYISVYVLNALIFFTQLVITVFLLACALIANPLLSCILFISVTVIAIYIQKYIRGKAYSLGTTLRSYDLYNSRIAMQGLQGLREIAIYDKKDVFQKEYRKYIKDYVSVFSTQMIFPSLPQWVLETVGICLLLVVLCLQIFLGGSVAETTGTLTLLAAISWRLLPAANKSMGAVLSMRSAQPILEQFFVFIDALPAQIPVQSREIRTFHESIQLRNMDFTYPTAEHAALVNVTLTIPKGAMIGIIGVSGSGKSTLTSLMTGLLHAQSGEILVDGKGLDSTSERLKIGYVPQNLYLLDATLAENVAFSHWGEPLDEARVMECCRMAAMDFLNDLPEGIRTQLGERGLRLSGGQIQRVGIARALYDRPELLIFDEATSALDGATEKAIQSTVNGLRQQMTMVLVAHRLSTVKHCDIIYWIDKGRLVMQGKPEQVLPAYEKRLGDICSCDIAQGQPEE